MKLLIAALVVSALTLAAQEPAAGGMKHVALITVNSVRPIAASALSIEREVRYPSVLHLKGQVEIRTPVCIATGKGTEHICSGYVILRTDEATFHEDSGKIEASGSVTLTREQ